MTYRERREARVERLRDWAEKREARANAAFAHSRQISDMIPFGQPILVGHHSEGRHRRDLGRIDSGMRQGVESSRMAERHNERADNIESAMDRSIYSDDPDAIEQLRVRIAGLEAERDRIKAFNVSCRKGQRALTLLDERQLANYLSCAKLTAYNLGKHGEFPAYHLSNLSGNISRNRERLARLERKLPPVSDPSLDAARTGPVDPDLTAAAPAFQVGISVDPIVLDTWHDDGGRVWE